MKNDNQCQSTDAEKAGENKVNGFQLKKSGNEKNDRTNGNANKKDAGFAVGEKAKKEKKNDAELRYVQCIPPRIMREGNTDI